MPFPPACQLPGFLSHRSYFSVSGCLRGLSPIVCRVADATIFFLPLTSSIRPCLFVCAISSLYLVSNCSMCQSQPLNLYATPLSPATVFLFSRISNLTVTLMLLLCTSVLVCIRVRIPFLFPSRVNHMLPLAHRTVFCIFVPLAMHMSLPLSYFEPIHQNIQ